MARRSPFGAGRGRARPRNKTRTGTGAPTKPGSPIRKEAPMTGRTPDGAVEEVVGSKTTADADKFLERMEGRSVDLEGGKITPAKAMEMRAKGQAVPTSILPRSERGSRYTDTAKGRIYKGNWHDSKGQIHAPEEIDTSGGKESSPAPTMSRGEGTKFFGSFDQPKRFQDDEKDPSRGANEAHLTPAERLYGDTSPGEFERAQTARVKTPAAKQARARVKKAGGIGLPPGYAKPKGKQLQQRQKLADRILGDISAGGEPKEKPEGVFAKLGSGLMSGARTLLTGKDAATRRREAVEKRESEYIKEGDEAGLDPRIVKSFLQKQRSQAAKKKVAKPTSSARQASIKKQNELMEKDDAAAVLRKQVADLIKQKADEAKKKKDDK